MGMTVAQAHSSVVYVNDVHIHYQSYGSGEPVILLHGWPQDGRAWRNIVPSLSEAHQVIIPDLRGAGLSDKPDHGYDKMTLAEDILLLIDALGFDKVSVVGHDIGGMVAFVLATKYPNRINKVVLLDLLIPSIGLEALMDVAQGGMWHFGFHMVQDLPEFLIQGKEQAYLRHFFTTLTYHPDTFSEEEISLYTEPFLLPGGLKAGFEYYRSILKEDQRIKTLLTQPIEIPILALGGASSTNDLLYQSLVPYVQNLSGIVVPDCGHFIPEEQPAFLIDALKNFL